MIKDTIRLIGKEFNPSTIQAQHYLDMAELSYTYIDVEFEPEYKDWLRFHKIRSIPVLIVGHQWIVGYTKRDYDAFFQHLNKEA